MLVSLYHVYRILLLGILLVTSPLVVRADVVASHVTVSVTSSTWSYTLFNDESGGSNNWLSTFTLFLNTPSIVTGTPAGWDVNTDGSTYVAWFNADLDPPFPHDVAPGTLLSDFVISSIDAVSQPGIYDLTSWDHVLNEPGPIGLGDVLVPESVQAVPEPSLLLLCFLCLGILLGVRSLAAFRL